MASKKNPNEDTKKAITNRKKVSESTTNESPDMNQDKKEQIKSEEYQDDFIMNTHLDNNSESDNVKSYQEIADEETNIYEPSDEVITAEYEETKKARAILLNTMSDEAITEYLKMINNIREDYKDKFDRGIITQEQYDKIKEDLADKYTNIDELIFNRDTSTRGAIRSLKEVSENSKGKLNNEIYIDQYPEINVGHYQKLQMEGSLTKKNLENVFLSASNESIKCKLLNSGFYVILRTPTLSSVMALMNNIKREHENYGYTLGLFSFMFGDYLLKEEFMRFIHDHILSSNLVKWNDFKTFCSAVSLHDFNVLLHSIATIMYPEGYLYKYTCEYVDKCDHQEEMLINLMKLKYSDISNLPEECIQVLQDKGHKSLDDLNKYRENLNLEQEIEHEYVRNNKTTTIKIITMVPTMEEFFNDAKNYTVALKEAIDIENSEDLNEYIKVTMMRMFTPWIKEIQSEFDNGTLKFTDSSEQISALDIIQIDNKLFVNDLQKTIEKTKLTHIAIPVSKCPKCGSKPSGAIDGLLAVDVTTDFFKQGLLFLAKGS